jgi:NADPH:quinone reductase
VALSKVVRIHKNGGPEELRYETVEVGAPSPDEVRLRHTAIGVNFTDIHHRTGRYPGPGFPLVLGMEAAAVVDEVGSNVRDLQVGERVVYGGASPSLSPGAYCQLRIMNPARLIKLPGSVDDETAAAVFLKGLTAQYLIRGAYPVRHGDTILIHAAAGGVGLIMCQWARHLGATVIGTVSSPEKAAIAREHGCEHPIISTQEDVVARVLELTNGQKLPVVFDSVGASTFETSLACLRRRGMLVSFGSSSGAVPPLDIFRLNRMGSLYLTGAGFADYTHTRAELLERAQELFAVVTSGAVQVAINQRYRLEDAARAHRDLEARRTIGSSILLPPQPA